MPASETSTQDVRTLPAHWLEADGSKMGLLPEEQISLFSVMHGMLLRSGNDAANVLAEATSGSVSRFVEELDVYLRSIGCKDTHFLNPHGLHHPDHLTTVHDLALMSKHAMGNPIFSAIVERPSLAPPTNKQGEKEIHQTNGSLRPGRFFYPKAIGIKTGYTSQAKNTLVAAARDQSRTLIAVVMGCQTSEERFQDTIRMFETAFNEVKIRKAVLSKTALFSREIKGAKDRLDAKVAHEVILEYFPSEEPEGLKTQVEWQLGRVPIQKGQKVGLVHWVDAQGTVWSTVDLIAEKEVRRTFLGKLCDFLGFFI